jgi:2-phosphosulfolactate phosphatase
LYIDVFPTADSIIPAQLAGKTALVIDVLRATSTITTALNNGAVQIYPTATIAEARRVASCFPAGTYLLGGERKGVQIPGFDLDNSPLRYKKEIVAAKTIIFTTSNGTKTIKHGKTAQTLLLAAFLNAKPAARMAWETKQDIFLLCSGTNGRFSLDDAACAGLLIEYLRQLDKRARLSDLAFTLHQLYLSHCNRLPDLLAHASHYRRLLDLNLQADIAYCLQTNICTIVPFWDGEKIIKKDGSSGE